jgi:hypothetical protein
VLAGQQRGSQPGGLTDGQVGQPVARTPGAGQPDVQGRQAKDARQERPHHVDRLDPGHRELPGIPP